MKRMHLAEVRSLMGGLSMRYPGADIFVFDEHADAERAIVDINYDERVNAVVISVNEVINPYD